MKWSWFSRFEPLLIRTPPWRRRRPRQRGCDVEIAASLSPLRHVRSIQRIADERREQDQARVAVRLEQPQAQVAIVDVDPADLPAEMRAEDNHADGEDRTGARRRARKPDQRPGKAVADDERQPGVLAE